jgi:glucose-1-phosphatase
MLFVIQTFLFDMGNVLVHFCHDRMCRQIGELCGRSSLDIRRWLIDSGLQWQFERGLVSPAEVHRQFESSMSARVDIEQLAFAASDIFSLNTPLLPVLDALKSRGHRMVLLSNTNVWHYDLVQRRFDVLRFFDDFVLSFEVQAMKPDFPIFRRALEVIKCDPAKCFYTDDVSDYILAARQHGIDAEVFTDVATLTRQLAERGVEVGREDVRTEPKTPCR